MQFLMNICATYRMVSTDTASRAVPSAITELLVTFTRKTRKIAIFMQQQATTDLHEIFMMMPYVSLGCTGR